MSAIWGVIDLNGNTDVKKTEEKMRRGYAQCIIDRTEYTAGENYAMGCGIQYVTAEAQLEKLPIIERGIAFTADAIVDNRAELLERLHYKRDDSTIPDARLLYEMFQNYGTSCLNDILGAYSFVYFDLNKEELYLVTDATGVRTLHYFYNDNILYFSTLIEPIVQAAGIKEVNNQWITDFLALDNMAWAMENDKTPYQGIYCLPAAHYLRITRKGMELVRYWNPDVTEIKQKNDEAYGELFRKVYMESVQRVMRNHDITMMLSGGLDSTSVASMVLKTAQQTGQTLTSFTSVPEKDFVSNLSSYYVTDESDAVRATKDYFSTKGYHLNCEFIDMEGRNSWDDREEELNIIEMPYKSMQNLLWIKECMKRSYEKGVRIMLSGAYGNITVSNSFQGLYQRELVRTGKWGQYIKECWICGQKNGLTKKETLKIMYQIFNESLHKCSMTDIDPSIIVGKSFMKNEWIKNEKFEQRAVSDNRIYQLSEQEKDYAKKLMVNEKVFYQSGETQTKHSLATGVIIRDPTMDKRLIELCMKLPLGCFAQKGVTRRMVKEYLKQDMPEHVIMPQHYGLQSADTARRLQKNGEKVFTEISQILHSETARKYLDVEHIDQYINEMKNFNKPDHNFDILRLEYTALVIEFIEKKLKV